MYSDKGEKEKAWYWWFRSYNYDKQRQEAFFELIKRCRETNEFEQGYICLLYTSPSPRD